MQGEKAGQTKTRTFNKLRGVKASPARVKSLLCQCKRLVINTLKEIKSENAVSAPAHRPGGALFLYFLYFLYFMTSIFSVPIYGRKTSGTTIDPSAC